jgi:hypothetical protein
MVMDGLRVTVLVNAVDRFRSQRNHGGTGLCMFASVDRCP